VITAVTPTAKHTELAKLQRTPTYRLHFPLMYASVKLVMIIKVNVYNNSRLRNNLYANYRLCCFVSVSVKELVVGE
jgi:hypothetical protein